MHLYKFIHHNIIIIYLTPVGHDAFQVVVAGPSYTKSYQYIFFQLLLHFYKYSFQLQQTVYVNSLFSIFYCIMNTPLIM